MKQIYLNQIRFLFTTGEMTNVDVISKTDVRKFLLLLILLKLEEARNDL